MTPSTMMVRKDLADALVDTAYMTGRLIGQMNSTGGIRQSDEREGVDGGSST